MRIRIYGCANRTQDLLIEDGAVTDRLSAPPTEEIDASGLCALPGMLDIHTHGAAGVDVNRATPEDYARMSLFLASQGTTGFLCSILTDTQEHTLWCLRQAAEALRRGLPGAALLGIHLEGPFLSPVYKGAMPQELLRRGDLPLFRRYQEAAEGQIRYLTVAPEVEGVPELISALREEVVIAIGHSNATYDQAMDAIQRGARASTHTLNAMRLLHQREPAIMGAALESDIWCEAICDGRHLHPGSVRLLLKCKGWNRVVAVTDSMMAAGLPDGQYQLGVNPVTVLRGDATITGTGVRAGSTLTQQQALRNLTRFTGCGLEQAASLMSDSPARLLGLSRKGRLAPGMDGDVTLVAADGTVRRTIVGGRTVYNADASQDSPDASALVRPPMV